MTTIEDDETFCFEDSDIHILSSEEDGVRWRFKVHRRVLAQSPVFNDMFTLGEPRQPGNPDANRPVVELQDHASDLENMFKKVYEGQKGYGIDIQTYEKMDLCDLADLAGILDKFQWRTHSEEVKAALCAILGDENLAPSLTLNKIAEFLPRLSQLDSKGIQSQLIKQLGDGLQEPYTSGDWDWSYEPDSYDEFASMEASLVADDVYVQMIARLSETLLGRKGETQKAQRRLIAALDYLKLLARPLGTSASHKRLACWVGVTRPAWQASIPQVMSGLWQRGWLSANEDNGFIFDLGKGKERDEALEPFLELDEEELDDCDECQKTIKRATTFLRSKYPRKKDTEGKQGTATPPVAPQTHTVIGGTPIISDSPLFNLPDATICILGASCNEGRRTRYRMNWKLALTSPVICSLIGSQDLDDARAGKEQIIEVRHSSEALDAMFQALYCEEFGEACIPQVPRLADASTHRLILAYIALKELGFDSYADKVRGYLRLQLLTPGHNSLPLESLMSLLRYATQQSDHALQTLSATYLHKNITTDHWLRTLSSADQYLRGIPRSQLRDLVIQLLQAHGRERVKEEDTRHKLIAVSIYGRALCGTPEVDESHQIYACYKLKCKPAWQAAQYEVVNLFLNKLWLVPSKPPEEAYESKDSAFVRLYEQFMDLLEGLNIGTKCTTCKQAIEDWVQSIQRVYYHEEDARKRKREEEKRKEEEQVRKRKRDHDDEGEHAADDAKKT